MNKWLQWPQWNVVGVAFFGLLSAELKADSWAAPSDSTHQSDNGQFQFSVTIGDILSRKKPTGTLRRKTGEHWEVVWTNRLVNQVKPIQVIVTDSGRYVVTFDEYHAVGNNPVVIYGENGRLIANLTLEELKLANHPKISRSVSSYWWNEKAIMLFGPPAKPGGEPWRRTLEDSLFIRLYWGEVIEIDLASGKVRDAAWHGSLPPDQAATLRTATDTHLGETWRRLAGKYFRKENFAPDPTWAGVTGILLVGQLRLREALPLLREIAATGRFQSWGAPSWKPGQEGNVCALARAAIAEIE